jgi:hypothetical protein
VRLAFASCRGRRTRCAVARVPLLLLLRVSLFVLVCMRSPLWCRSQLLRRWLQLLRWLAPRPAPVVATVS